MVPKLLQQILHIILNQKNNKVYSAKKRKKKQNSLAHDIMWKPRVFWLRVAMTQGRKRVGTKQFAHEHTVPRRKLSFTVPSFFTFFCMLQGPAGPYYLHVHKHLELNPTNRSWPISDWLAEFFQTTSLSFDKSKKLLLVSLWLHTDWLFPLWSILTYQLSEQTL